VLELIQLYNDFSSWPSAHPKNKLLVNHDLIKTVFSKFLYIDIEL
jgi:hypothetical protein